MAFRGTEHRLEHQHSPEERLIYYAEQDAFSVGDRLSRTHPVLSFVCCPHNKLIFLLVNAGAPP